jgi:hypothetical protein
MSTGVDWFAAGLAISSFAVSGLTLLWTIYANRRQWPLIAVRAECEGRWEKRELPDMILLPEPYSVEGFIKNVGGSDDYIQSASFRWSQGILRHPISWISWYRRQWHEWRSDRRAKTTGGPRRPERVVLNPFHHLEFDVEEEDIELEPRRSPRDRSGNPERVKLPSVLPANSAADFQVHFPWFGDAEKEDEEQGEVRSSRDIGPWKDLADALVRGIRVTMEFRTETGRTVRTVVKRV